MTDRELLERAAKAAGYEYAKHGGYIVVDGIPGNWNPLTDDGDALRLAVKLKITDLALAVGEYVVREKYREGDSIETITRRAIVRAAAAIGESVP